MQGCMLISSVKVEGKEDVFEESVDNMKLKF